MVKDFAYGHDCEGSIFFAYDILQFWVTWLKLIMSRWDENNANGNNILSIHKHTHIGLAND
jgi:hypothetical protein